MAEIIKFKRQATEDERIEAYKAEPIAQCQENGIRLFISDILDGAYSIGLMQDEPCSGTGRKVVGRDKAIKVYRNLELHILNRDRTFEELVGMLSTAARD